MQKGLFKTTVDFIYFIIGAVVGSVAVNMFLVPNEISPGGFTGVATAINHLSAIPTGTMLLILNIPILILGYIKMGGLFILKTAFATVLSSVALDTSTIFLRPFKTDGILAAMFGGILLGFSISLIMLRGATTGGVDIIAKLVNRKYRHLSVGKIMLITDALIITINALIYKNIQSALYSVVAMYAATRTMDLLLYGADKGKIIYIITKSADVICKKINMTLARGVTKLSVTGGYTGNARTMLMCVVRAHEVSSVQTVIKEFDPQAFIVVSDAGEIIGEGFKLQP